MSNKKFVATTGSHLSDDQAQIVGEELETIKETEGQLTPAIVVKRAEKEESKLHGFFTWDDKAAADEYRLNEARYLLRSVEVYYEVEPGGDEKPVRAFYHVEDDEEGAIYVDIDDVVSNDDYRQQIIDKALREMRSWAAKYRQYKELSPVVEAIDKL